MFGKKEESAEISIEDVVNELEKGHRVFKSFEKGLDVAKTIRTLKQTELEVNERISIATAEMSKRESDLADAIARHDETMSKARKEIIVAQNQAEKILSDASEAADKKIAVANDAAAQSYAMAVEKINALQAKAENLEKLANSLAYEVAEREASLAEINERLVKAKEAFKKAMGDISVGVI